MTGFELVAYKVAAGALGSVTSAIFRSALAPRAGSLIVSQGSTGRLKNKLIPTVEINERDLKEFSRHVIKIITPLLAIEYRSLTEFEVEAALEAVREAFSRTSADVFEHDLDPTIYANQVISEFDVRMVEIGLSETGEQFYRKMVVEVSGQMLNFITTWPSFLARADVEQLRRTTRLAKELNIIKRAVIEDASVKEMHFEEKYSEVVIDKLDHLELFGVTLSQPGQRAYPLSTAYISLSVAESAGSSIEEDEFGGELAGIDERPSWRKDSVGIDADAGGGLRAETAISSFSRILLRGDAGSGKTTLLHWLAVNAARRSLDGELKKFNGFIPFVLPLRRYAARDLPAAHDFLSEIGKQISGEMPNGWVNRVLRSGNAFILIDGVDELPESRRDEAKEWLHDLMSAYPRARYIVTSRPAAAEDKWLTVEKFSSVDMLPMSPLDIDNFVHHWHEATRLCLPPEAENEDHEELLAYESELTKAIRRQRQLRKLASNPLLCALLCTLSRDRRMQLPQGRMELYAAALDMLLVRRDVERRIKHQDAPSLTLKQKQRVLGHFAYWLLRNQLSDTTEENAIGQVRLALESMPSVGAVGETVYRYLMVRSGVLRQPVDGRVDFIHRTFQEYLAAANIIAHNDIASLVNNAHLDQWHEVVSMAVGHARQEECSEILRKLIDRGNAETENTTRLHLLAAACLENADEVDREVFDLVRGCAAKLIPPSKVSEAKELALVGESVLPLLPKTGRNLLAPQAASTVRTASLVGGEAALEVLAGFGSDGRKAVYTELARAWTQFDVNEFADKVMKKSPIAKRTLVIDHAALLSTLHNFPELTQLSCRCPIDDFDWVDHCKSLEWLSIGNASIQAMEKIAQLARLRYFGVSDVESDADWFQHLADLKSLATLTFRFGQNGNWDPNVLPLLEELKAFRISGAGLVSFNGARYVLPKLVVATVTVARGVDLAGLEELPHLRHLQLWQVGSVQNAALLSGLEDLRVEVLSSRGKDLPELAKIENVKRLIIRVLPGDSGKPIDLSPFAGHRGVDILLARSGAFFPTVEELGDGVSVNRYGMH